MSPAVFQIVSDLHLETRASYDFALKQTAPNLALLGDIGQVADDRLFVFLEKQLKRYWNVFFLLGNHEPAGTTWPEAKRRVRSFADRMESLRARSTTGRFVFLDQTRYDLDDTLTILGCTLFSRVTDEQRLSVASRFIDFRQIRQWHIDDHAEAHASDLRWLDAQVAGIAASAPERQIVIFTHHSPTTDERSIKEKHRESPVSSGFSTDLRHHECWENPSVILWAFGHTHYNCDYVDGSKRVATNQLGYALAPVTTFDTKKYFLLERPESR